MDSVPHLLLGAGWPWVIRSISWISFLFCLDGAMRNFETGFCT